MDETANLGLPYIAAAQAQKHVTHNEALRALDALVQAGIIDTALTTPPGSPSDGDRYIPASGATGAWSGKDGQIAAFQDNGWLFYQPQAGWLAYVVSDNRLVVWNGSAWQPASDGTVNPAPLVGVNTTASNPDKLAVKSDGVLFSHDDVTPGSGDIQARFNKSATANKASVLFQDNWSGRAEIGLVGDNNFHFKVSTDGQAWTDALVLVAASGTPRVPVFTKALLPGAATAGTGAIVCVSDDVGGTVPAFSDGTDWRRVTDRAVIA